MADPPRNVGTQGHAGVGAGGGGGPDRGDDGDGDFLRPQYLIHPRCGRVAARQRHHRRPYARADGRRHGANLYGQRRAAVHDAGLPGVLLLPGRAARRAARPQPAVLEVAAGVGPADGAVQGRAGPGGDAADHHRHRHRAVAVRGAVRLRGAAGPWHQSVWQPAGVA